MNSHIKGPVTALSQAAIVSQRGFELTFGDTTAKKLCTVEASAEEPVLVEFLPIVTQVFNAATTNVLTVGSDPTANQYLGAGDVAEGTLGVGTIKRFLLTARTDIYGLFTQTGTAATTGRAVVLMRATGMGNGKDITY